jgi:hypothetical protein
MHCLEKHASHLPAIFPHINIAPWATQTHALASIRDNYPRSTSAYQVVFLRYSCLKQMQKMTSVLGAEAVSRRLRADGSEDTAVRLFEFGGPLILLLVFRLWVPQFDGEGGMSARQKNLYCLYLVSMMSELQYLL